MIRRQAKPAPQLLCVTEAREQLAGAPVVQSPEGAQVTRSGDQAKIATMVERRDQLPQSLPRRLYEAAAPGSPGVHPFRQRIGSTRARDPRPRHRTVAAVGERERLGVAHEARLFQNPTVGRCCQRQAFIGDAQRQPVIALQRIGARQQPRAIFQKLYAAVVKKAPDGRLGVVSAGCACGRGDEGFLQTR